MTYYTIPPSPQIAAYVRFFWILENDTMPLEPFIYRSMADGCAELIFHYKGAFEEITAYGNQMQSDSMIHAQSQNYRRFITYGPFGIFGVYLYPYAIPKLFSFPSTDLSNHMPALESLLGKAGQLLSEKIMTARNNAERVQITTKFLHEIISKDDHASPAIQAAVTYLIRLKGMVNVSQLARNFCLSPRQFERKFKEYSGFSPKLYSRIIRFQSAINEYGNNYKSLTELAYKCGYYDQSHFIHDFKEFSGYHPKQYFSGNAEGVEYREV